MNSTKYFCALIGSVLMVFTIGCTVQSTTDSLTTPAPGSETLVSLSKNDLAQKIGLPETNIRLVSVDATSFGDTSLGVSEPGGIYAQVITPGFIIVLNANGKDYEYHSDMNNRVVFYAPIKTKPETTVIIGTQTTTPALPGITSTTTSANTTGKPIPINTEKITPPPAN